MSRSHTAAMSAPRADYGIDAPPVVRNLIIGGVIGLLIAAAIYSMGGHQQAGLLRSLFRTGLFAGTAWIATALHMIYGSRVRKLRLRDQLLDELRLRGDELALDVGCGRGLMLIGVAKRLQQEKGRAMGIDLWQTADQSGNSLATTQRNVEIEGMVERVQLHTGDARKLPFPDGTFNLVVSTWALHNIPSREGRAQAVREIARVLSPGGRLLLVDIQYTRDYVRVLREAGIADARRRLLSFLFAIPSFRVDGTKT